MIATSTPAADDDTSATPERWFRGDIDGLRAIAIVLVVAYHAGVPGFGGGFIGVDAFFVISGYLITRKLVTESTQTGRVGLLDFWGKRIRRLVPALSLMLLVTLAASSRILPGWEMRNAIRQAGAAALYVSNILFAREVQDYFATDIRHSPFLHTWSLGVEEQFYVFWPLLFVAGALLVRRRRERMQTVLVSGFSVLAVGSFALCLALTARGTPWAFYSFPTRAWEFAVAGLLATVTAPAWLTRGHMRTVTAIAGLVLLAAATLLLTDTTPYPGAWALLPVLGTALVIVSGDGGQGPSPVSRMLQSPPMQGLGRVSYSWYLWHWPFIVLAVAAFDDESLRVRGGAAVLSLPAAYLAYRLVENPLRFSTRLRASKPLTYAMGAIGTALVFCGLAFFTQELDNRPVDDFDVRLETVQRNGEYQCVDARSPSGLPYCVGGDVTSDRVILLLGDSHAAMWQPALGQVASELGYKLADQWFGNCPAIDVQIQHELAETDTDCDRIREELWTLVDELDPDLVVVANGAGYIGRIEEDEAIPDESRQVDLWRDAYAGYLDEMQARGENFVVFIDNPMLEELPRRCINDNRSIVACEPTPEEAFAITQPILDAEEQVREGFPDLPTFTVNDDICSESRCYLEIDGNLVYRDNQHLTREYLMTQVPRLRAFVEEALPDRD